VCDVGIFHSHAHHCFVKGFVVDGEFDAALEVCGAAVGAKGYLADYDFGHGDHPFLFIWWEIKNAMMFKIEHHGVDFCHGLGYG